MTNEIIAPDQRGAYAHGVPVIARVQRTFGRGLQKLSGQQRQGLLEVIEDRHGRRATLIASQLPTKHWHDATGEATLADAILDRLLHRADRIELTGVSMRSDERPDLTERDRAR